MAHDGAAVLILVAFLSVALPTLWLADVTPWSAVGGEVTLTLLGATVSLIRFCDADLVNPEVKSEPTKLAVMP